VGVAHAGWRGAAAGVVENLVAALRRHFGSRPEELLAGVGPTIGVARYAVGAEVLDAFRRRVAWADECVRPVGEAVHFDLAAANACALRGCGIPLSAIEVAGLCTHEREDLLYSYRRQGPGNGHHGLVAGWAD
jgi:copper oxidase (laccase) domain-containing protein